MLIAYHINNVCIIYYVNNLTNGLSVFEVLTTVWSDSYGSVLVDLCCNNKQLNLTLIIMPQFDCVRDCFNLNIGEMEPSFN